jgi:hypothetical protein
MDPADDRHAGMALALMGATEPAIRHLRRLAQLRDERDWVA